VRNAGPIQVRPNEFVGFATPKKRMRSHPNLIRGYDDFKPKNARQTPIRKSGSEPFVHVNSSNLW
jgi:hypothetical protein